MQTQASEAERGPRVQVIAVEQGPSSRDVTLLGDVRPFAAVTLYAKVGGYLKTLRVDKGDAVQAGQTIAEIESAETDQQYSSAVADLDNKRRLAERARQLAARQFMSVEAAETAQTNVRMAEARVGELGTLKSYEIVRAPFAGVVTARFVDPGALIQNAETNQTSNQPIVALVDSSRLRIYAHLDQQDVPFVHIGDAAAVADAANPTRRIEAKVTRTAGELDAATRTLLVEIDVDNREGFVLPGSFVNVILKIPTVSYPRVPAGALVLRGTDPYLAAVGEDGRVHFEAIRIASTDGAAVNIASGATVGQRVALNVPSTVPEGGRIQPLAVAAAH
ncbi:MAG: efflux RND transporter periplasmic adaptor subunit [Alphaproteobacteria bacterium]|nr:efflux RND transporter periplasmic adaptor subunit [Alphaproteobacteria bacterium]